MSHFDGNLVQYTGFFSFLFNIMSTTVLDMAPDCMHDSQKRESIGFALLIVRLEANQIHLDLGAITLRTVMNEIIHPTPNTQFISCY